MMKTTTCTKCGKQIIWAKQASGKVRWVKLDPQPLADLNGSEPVAVARAHKASEHLEIVVYRPSTITTMRRSLTTNKTTREWLESAYVYAIHNCMEEEHDPS